MSCNASSNLAGQAGNLNGQGRLSGKAANAAGQILDTALRRAGQVSTAALTPVHAFDGPQKIAALRPAAAIAALCFRQNRQARNTALNIAAAAEIGAAVSRAAGTAVARTARGETAVESRFFFKNTPPVRVWRADKVSRRLNALEIAGPAGARVTVQAAAGTMFELNGKTWHRGALSVETPQGERVLTHLQTLGWPGEHYYFNRSVGEREVAGIMLGFHGFEPKHLPGFAGQVSELESLSPWGAVKHNLIRLHLLHGSGQDLMGAKIQAQPPLEADPPPKAAGPPRRPTVNRPPRIVERVN